ncbi:MAG: hypothetical protein OPY03_01820 [Nitrosopumilus sp.]|nr:hypothetical protein [Nitrosopumilus sp.]
MSNELSITKIKDIDELTEAVRVIRSDVDRKETALRVAIDEFLEFLETEDAGVIPYALRKENRSLYKEPLAVIKRSMTFAISSAKNIRMELYNPTHNEESSYEVPTNLSNLPVPSKDNEKGDKLSMLKQTLGMKKTIHYDPNSPQAKMEELISGLTEILDIFKRWIIWLEGLILERLAFNTTESLQSELNQLIRIFGSHIETSIWISFQYYRDMREAVAEKYSIMSITALQKQQDREATRPVPFDPNQPH